MTAKSFIISLSILILIGCINSGSQDKKRTDGGHEIKVEWEKPLQKIIGNGINFEGYHTNGGTEILSPKFKEMMNELPCQLNRLSMPLKIWEPINDNDDPQAMDFSKFADKNGAKYTFLRIQELKKRGIDSWLSIWDLPDWNVSNPQKNNQRRVKNFDEMAESITSFILYGKENYGIEPLFISVNEPTIATENGWGGYQLILTPEEQIKLIIKTGKMFEKYNISTRWLIGLHKIYPSEIEQAQTIYSDTEVQKYIAGFDFHGYSMQTPDKEEYLKIWKEWVKTTGLFTLSGETDYDNAFWEKDERKYWEKASVQYGLLIYKLLNLAGVNGIMPWYGNVPFNDFPYRYVSKHYMEAFPAGTQLVASSASHNNLLVTAGKNGDTGVIVLHNTSTLPIIAYIENEDYKTYEWVSSKDKEYMIKKESISNKDKYVEFLLSANSLHTITCKK